MSNTIFIFIGILVIIYLWWKQDIDMQVGILGYKTKNFHLSNGMSQSTFYSMKEGGISDTSLKEFLIMEDRFLELEKLSVCSGMSRKYESFELSKLIKDTFLEYDFSYHTIHLKQISEPSKLINRNITCL